MSLRNRRYGRQIIVLGEDEQHDHVETPNLTVQNTEAFQLRLNAPVPVEDIKINEAANNSKYLPISFIQTRLDELFLGLWQTENFRTQTIANEVVGSIDLLVFHPVAKTWIRRTGSAAVMIQFKSVKNGGNGNLTDVNNKITNTLVKDFPHLMAECIKSAARTLGVSMGRDLNRKHTDTYTPLSAELAQEQILRDKIQFYLDSNTLPSDLHKQLQASIHIYTKPLLAAALKMCEKAVPQLQSPEA